MNVRKFIAGSAREALHMVKDMLGPDAIILSNRSVVGGVEIMAVAAKDMAMIVPQAGAPAAASAKAPVVTAPVIGDDDDYRVSLSRPPVAPSAKVERAPEASLRAVDRPRVEPARRPEVRTEPRLELRAETGPAVSAPGFAQPVAPAVMDEIRELRRMVEQHLAGSAWNEMSRNAPVKTAVLKHMLDAGFSPSLSRDLLTKLPSDMDFSEGLNWARSAADRELFTLGSDSDIIDRGGVFALVGPTGAGKTTTTAKLAARCVLRHGADKVALVTTDTYRIGAHEQLRIYGRILGVPVYVVKDAVDLQQTLRELQRKHMVLIDTMGMSQRDRHVAQQIAMLNGCDVRQLLVMSATSRGDTLDDVVRSYSGDGLAGCVLSKIDEAVSLATALDAVIRHRIPVCYVSNGQRVPEDLHLPNRAYLLHRSFKSAAEGSAHRFAEAEPALMMASAGYAAEARRA
jgi:flagellar biosynthesis protein FlhF